MTLTRGGSKGVMDVRECRLLIDGKWIGASSQENFETTNPATGEVPARCAAGNAEDVQRQLMRRQNPLRAGSDTLHPSAGRSF